MKTAVWMTSASTTKKVCKGIIIILFCLFITETEEQNKNRITFSFTIHKELKNSYLPLPSWHCLTPSCQEQISVFDPESTTEPCPINFFLPSFSLLSPWHTKTHIPAPSRKPTASSWHWPPRSWALCGKRSVKITGCYWQKSKVSHLWPCPPCFPLVKKIDL